MRKLRLVGKDYMCMSSLGVTGVSLPWTLLLLRSTSLAGVTRGLMTPKVTGSLKYQLMQVYIHNTTQFFTVFTEKFIFNFFCNKRLLRHVLLL